MASLGSSLSTALQALRANQIGLAVASNNIANVNTPGYSRQRAIIQEAPSIGDRIRIGTGVDVIGTEAIRDRFVERKLWGEASWQSASDLRHQSLSDIETQFNGIDGDGLNTQIADFFNSFQKLSTNPTSPDLRQQVITSATALTRAINARAADLQNTKTDANQAVQDDVAKGNSLIQAIADTTGRIQGMEASKQPANELRDQRALLVRQLAEVMNVREMETNGTYQLTTGNNRLLVIDNNAQPLTTAVSSNGMAMVQSGGIDITSEFVSGTLASRIALRDTSIPQYAQSLDQMAFDLASQVNQLHSVSFDRNGNTGIDFFTAITAVAGAASSLRVDPAVAADSSRIAASSQAAGTDNEAAIALGNLLNTPIPPRGTVADQFRSLVFQIGSDTANAKLDLTQHSAMVTQLENLRSSISGVSIDEETTSVLQFQRAFQASARVISTIDELLQTALSMHA